MSPELYRQAGELFARLRALPDDQFLPELDRACRGNPELHSQVRRLIAADRRAGRAFLDGRAVEEAAKLLTPDGAGLPAAGTVIGNYRLIGRIGAGGMGVVYEGHDLRLGRRVALKILPLAPAGEADERVLRFQREARAASTLNHPHIVSIFEADAAEGYHYIAMEFVEGQTLRQIVRERKPPDSQQILDWIGQTAAALSAAHEAGIVHRDIKPENIMVRPDGFVKVLDFGLAKLREPTSGEQSQPDLLTRPGNLAGTIHYLSPEQIEGAPAGPRSDLFSLGVVAYELAAGVRPFDGPTDGAVFNAILTRTPPFPSAVRPSVGSELDNLIMRALEKDPELRYQTAGDLRSSCRRINRNYIGASMEKDRQTGAPRHSPPPARPAPHRRARRQWLMWTAGLLLCALTAAVYWMMRPSPAPVVTRIVKITNDTPEVKGFVTDGTRIYYAAGNRSADMQVFQIGINGGDPVPMPRLTGMLPLDISPDHSKILAGQILKGAINQGTTDGPFPVWVVDTIGNAARRLGDMAASYARWSANGDEILFVNGTQLRIARSDGSQSRLVAALKGFASDPAWAPGGRLIRFALDANGKRELWQVNADGSHLSPLLPAWTGYTSAGGSWTPDGRYFLFSGGKGDDLDVWALRQGRRLFGTGFASPARLTTGPLKAYSPVTTPDGLRILFSGGLTTGELVRYDPKSDRWTPYLGGLPGMEVDFSRDGKWVTYVHFPDASVWRSALDGSDRLQLTEPMHALNPRWSPDGSSIAFAGEAPGQLKHVYIVPAAGGPIRQLEPNESAANTLDDVTWSADGASLAGCLGLRDQSLDPRERMVIAVIDLRTGHVSRLPGSEGLWSARWSPDGRHIAALGFPNRLWLYDLAAHSATQLTTIGAGWPSWSRDSQYIYFQDFSFSEWCRLRISDRKVERVTSLAGIKMTGASFGWCGLDPDGGLISTRNTGGTAVYSLDWEAP